MRRYSRTAAVLLFLCAFAPAKAQDAMTAIPGQTVLPGTSENARARMEFFYARKTYPDGTIPVGAKVDAWREMRSRPMAAQPLRRGAAEPVWTNVGPFNIGGRINTVAVNPLDGATIFIGAAGGGIWRTRDGGAHWHSVSDDLPTQALGAIAIHPADTNIVYAGTGEANYGLNTFEGGGMFRSSDGGDSWERIGEGTLPPFGRASDIVINPLNPSVLYAAIPDGVREDERTGIYRSTDGGDTWELVLGGMMNDLAINPRNPAVLYTASSKVTDGRIVERYGLFKTTDGGDSWVQLDIGVTDSLMGRTSIGLCDADPDVLYIGVSEVSSSAREFLIGVFKSTDGGSSWKKLTLPFDYMVSQGWYDNIIGVHPGNPDIVYAGGVKLVYSTDGGATWTRVLDEGYGGILHVDQHAVAFDPQDPSTVYIGNDGGFYVGRNNGRDWEKRDQGMSITQFIGGDVHPSTDALLFGGTQDNGTMMSTSAPTFGRILYGDGGNGAVDYLRPNIWYTTKQQLQFFRSEDFGNTWTRMQSGIGVENSLFYIDYAMDRFDPEVLYLATYRMYKTTNGGINWVQTDPCLISAQGGGCYYISTVFTAPYSSDVVLAGATGGNVAVSVDAGSSWTVCGNGLLPQAYCSAVRSYEPGVLYATYSRYGVPKVWRSNDTGRTWISINGDLPDIPAYDIISLDGSLVLATELGTFISSDEGATWQRFGTGMPSVAVMRFKYNERIGVLRAMTHGRGMYDMQWKLPPDHAPVFVSTAPGSEMDPAQPFVYAPVVDAWPQARFSLDEAPPGTSVDERFGIVRWNAVPGEARFTLRAANNAGAATQSFTVGVRPAPAADWDVVRSDAMSTPVNGMDAAPPATLWIVRDSAMVSRSTDGGVSWSHTQLPGTSAQALTVQALDGAHAVVGTRDGQVFRTSDGGATWTSILRTVNSRFGNVHFHDALHGVAVSEHENKADSLRCYITTDGGTTWNLQPVTEYAYFPIDNTLHFADDRNGWVASWNAIAATPAEAEILRTTDGGASWWGAKSSLPYVGAISFFDDQNGFFVDPVSGLSKRSTNGGKSWRPAFFPMNGSRNVAIHADRTSGALWVVNDSSAWVSRDRGTVWTETRLAPAGPVAAAAWVDSVTGWVAHANGVVQKLRVNPLLSTGAPDAAVPAGIAVSAGYPNPVRAGAAVAVPFRIDRSMHVRITLHNAAGFSLGTIVDRRLDAGRHQVSVSTEGLAPGVYFYTLSGGAHMSTGRVVVTR
jgi:photosystem II stability/assembly factor-like uncharacterized protein